MQDNPTSKIEATAKPGAGVTDHEAKERPAPALPDKKKLCAGCRNDYYNRPGNSTTGECWMLKTAKPVERTRIGVWQNPPYQWQPTTTLSCHHPDNGTTWIRDDDCRIADPIAQRQAEDEAGDAMGEERYGLS